MRLGASWPSMPRRSSDILGHSHADDAVLIESAIGGEEEAFHELIKEQRRELHAHCYRILGSFEDADDAVQETLVRAWRALPSFAGRSSLRTWVFKIATNASLDLATKRSRRELPTSFRPEAGWESGRGNR